MNAQKRARLVLCIIISEINFSQEVHKKYAQLHVRVRIFLNQTHSEKYGNQFYHCITCDNRIDFGFKVYSDKHNHLVCGCVYFYGIL